MIARARAIIALGESVVLDASWSDVHLRDEAAGAAHSAGADLLEVRCTAPAPVAAARIARRSAGSSNASDATPEIARLMADRADPWPTAVTVDTAPSPLVSLRALRRIVEAQPPSEPIEAIVAPERAAGATVRAS
ncbi:MAG: AAA family ATPase, partial [Actinomycetota bacterium]